MKVELTKQFVKDFKKLSPTRKQKANRALSNLPGNILNKKQTGMKVKKMTNRPDIYEARVDLHCRMTFNKRGSSLIMRRIGGHNIYKNP